MLAADGQTQGQACSCGVFVDTFQVWTTALPSGGVAINGLEADCRDGMQLKVRGVWLPGGRARGCG